MMFYHSPASDFVKPWLLAASGGINIFYKLCKVAEEAPAAPPETMEGVFTLLPFSR